MKRLSSSHVSLFNFKFHSQDVPALEHIQFLKNQQYFYSIFSNLNLTTLRIMNKMRQISILASILPMRVILPALEINCLFYKVNLLQNLSSTPSRTVKELCPVSKGSPKQEVRREFVSHPSSKARISGSTTLSIGKMVFVLN